LKQFVVLFFLILNHRNVSLAADNVQTQDFETENSASPIGRTVNIEPRREFLNQIDLRTGKKYLADSSRSSTVAETAIHAPTTVVAFISSACSCSPDQLVALGNLAKKYSKQGDKVQFLAFDTNQNTTMKNRKKFLSAFKFGFPVFFDKDIENSKRFKAERTPQIFVLDSSSKIQFSGSIFDSKDINVLEPAVASILKGEAPKLAINTQFGCGIRTF
jgi:hypothetical protein